MKKKAIVLLSGGLDSATTLYYAKKKRYDCRCLIFDYGQRHRREIESAKKVARACGVPWRLLKFDLPWKASALLDEKIPVPEGRTLKQISKGIPSTYVPARNTIFLSFAISYAEAIGAQAILMGANAIDFSGYPDCRPEYFEIVRKLIERGTKCGAAGKKIRLLTPLIKRTKAQIIKIGMRLKVPYKYTWSCYEGGERPCLKCDSCELRAKGFKEAGREDPLLMI